MKINKIICIGNFGIEKVITPKSTDSFPGGAGFRFSLFGSRYMPLLTIGIVEKNKSWDLALKILVRNHVDISNIQKVDKGITFITQYDKNNKLVNFNIQNPDLMHRLVALRYKFRLDKSVLVHICPLDFSSQACLVKKAVANNAIISMQLHHSSINTNNINKYQSILKLINYLFLNEHEAQKLTYNKSTEKAGIKISRYIKDYVVITKGAKGVAIYKSGKIVYVEKAIPIKFTLTLEGAGDALAAGFIAGMYLYDDVILAAKLGLITANFSIKFKNTLHILDFIEQHYNEKSKITTC